MKTTCIIKLVGIGILLGIGGAYVYTRYVKPGAIPRPRVPATDPGYADYELLETSRLNGLPLHSVPNRSRNEIA